MFLNAALQNSHKTWTPRAFLCALSSSAEEKSFSQTVQVCRECWTRLCYVEKCQPSNADIAQAETYLPQIILFLEPDLARVTVLVAHRVEIVLLEVLEGDGKTATGRARVFLGRMLYAMSCSIRLVTTVRRRQRTVSRELRSKKPVPHLGQVGCLGELR